MLMLLFYHALLALGVGGFAAYDIFYRRVPNRALAVFLPIAAAMPFILAYFAGVAGGTSVSFLNCLLRSLFGAAAGGGVLLAASLFTKGGIGGGDIKLVALMGCAYGMVDIMLILLIAAPLSLIVGLVVRQLQKTRRSLPFVPFLFFGCLGTTFLNFYIGGL